MDMVLGVQRLSQNVEDALTALKSNCDILTYLNEFYSNHDLLANLKDACSDATVNVEMVDSSRMDTQMEESLRIFTTSLDEQTKSTQLARDHMTVLLRGLSNRKTMVLDFSPFLQQPTMKSITLTYIRRPSC